MPINYPQNPPILEHGSVNKRQTHKFHMIFLCLCHNTTPMLSSYPLVSWPHVWKTKGATVSPPATSVSSPSSEAFKEAAQKLLECFLVVILDRWRHTLCSRKWGWPYWFDWSVAQPPAEPSVKKVQEAQQSHLDFPQGMFLCSPRQRTVLSKWLNTRYTSLSLRTFCHIIHF